MAGARPATPAAERVAAEIAEHGPITFHRFMELALFDGEVGYYARADAGPGAERDYLTSSELHSGFAALLSTQLVEMWRKLGEPDPFWLVEAGPGTGTFAEDLLNVADALQPRFAAALRVGLLEASAALRQIQEARLGSFGPRVRWLEPGAEGDQALGPGCVFANEVMDALPVHRVAMTEAGLQEIFTDAAPGGFADALGPLSTPAIAEQLAASGGRLAPGEAGEVNLDAGRLIARLARLVDPGYLVLLDYGEPATLLYGPRFPRGTLRCYWRHTVNHEPYRRIGLQDITAHVDLTAVTRAAESVGLTLMGATRQARLLRRLGFGQLVASLERQRLPRVIERAHRVALALLVDPRELGNLAALVFGREVPTEPLLGFAARPTPPPRVPGELLRLHTDPVMMLHRRGGTHQTTSG